MGSLAVITGANKGIGLVLARHLRNKGYSVVASCRTASHELDNIGKVVEGVDVRCVRGDELGRRLRVCIPPQDACRRFDRLPGTPRGSTASVRLWAMPR